MGVVLLRRAAAGGEGLVENLLGDVENARGEDKTKKSGGGKRKKRTEKRAGDKDTLEIWMADQRLGRKFGRCVKIAAKAG